MTGSPLPTTTACPRCGGGFACGAATGRCDCFELQLTEALRAELAARFDGCLCMACLRELSGPTPSAPGDSRPLPARA
ncbi:MAG: hypothetical protein EKK52_08665 [Burkholderiales bacterium]|uniref:cysteine-rich CWC family protein n=1 Tax=Roseateles sp. TaxID=1971397 RepID=UPI000F9F14CD|nr:MAG: hypothetical protein EKK52_08665 [Burkholderiales bacterium]